MKVFSRGMFGAIALLVMFLVAVSSTGLVNTVTAVEEGTLEDFCTEVGTTSLGAVPDSCTIHESDQSDEGRQLLGENGIVVRTINLISWLTGLLAGIFLVVGAVKFATSGGNTEKVNSAKRTVIYSVVGLVVLILGRVIVAFVVRLVEEI